MKLQLDQIYTKPQIAKKCWDLVNKTFNLEKHSYFFIEPAAGEGAFLNLLPPVIFNRTAFDLYPKKKEIIKQNFLTWDYRVILQDKNDVIVIGNPPFGHRANMAIKFFNQAAEMADTIAFIVPVQFRKYSVQKQLNPDFRLIRKKTLPFNSFYTNTNKFGGVMSKKTYCINTEFQIWTRLPIGKNRRIQSPPPKEHKHFQMWQYNNTKNTLKVFENKFDFAVPRQGFNDYTRKETDEKNCERNKQWILFKAKTPYILLLLKKINFTKLAKNNTIIPGFGKADVVKAYNKIINWDR